MSTLSLYPPPNSWHLAPDPTQHIPPPALPLISILKNLGPEAFPPPAPGVIGERFRTINRAVLFSPLGRTDGLG
jgi:hypothetical protein